MDEVTGTFTPKRKTDQDKRFSSSGSVRPYLSFTAEAPACTLSHQTPHAACIKSLSHARGSLSPAPPFFITNPLMAAGVAGNQTHKYAVSLFLSSSALLCLQSTVLFQTAPMILDSSRIWGWAELMSQPAEASDTMSHRHSGDKALIYPRADNGALVTLVFVCFVP